MVNNACSCCTGHAVKLLYISLTFCTRQDDGDYQPMIIMISSKVFIGDCLLNSPKLLDSGVNYQQAEQLAWH